MPTTPQGWTFMIAEDVPLPGVRAPMVVSSAVGLTAREMDVMRHVTEGGTSRQAAATLSAGPGDRQGPGLFRFSPFQPRFSTPPYRAGIPGFPGTAPGD